MKRGPGRPPWKEPREKRQQVVAVRLSDKERQGLKSEIDSAGGGLTASDVIREAVAFYLCRQNSKRDDPRPPEHRNGNGAHRGGGTAVAATVQVESERATITFHTYRVAGEIDAWAEALEAMAEVGPGTVLEALEIAAEQEELEIAAEEEEQRPRARSKRN